MPTTVHELRGQSYMRHRPSYAGILHESRRRLAHPRTSRYARPMTAATSMTRALPVRAQVMRRMHMR